jgi:23S rRNA (guanosine2251-2'-O)-methyltransferase
MNIKIYGFHAIESILINRPQDIKTLYILDGKNKEVTKTYIAKVKRYGVSPSLLSYQKFISKGDFKNKDSHQGIFAIVKQKEVYDESDLNKLKPQDIVIALDQVSNPRNFAAIIRSCAFFNVKSLIYLKNRPVDIDAEVTQMSVGGVEALDFYKVTNFKRTILKLKELGFWVYGFSDTGSINIYEEKLAQKSVFVIGAEGQGMRRLTTENIDTSLYIPGGKKEVNCLNAGVAGSIALAEYRRNFPF